MLTILALHYSYSNANGTLILKHFGKASAMAEWLLARRSASLHYAEGDPRRGIPPGTDEGDDFKVRCERAMGQGPGVRSQGSGVRSQV